MVVVTEPRMWTTLIILIAIYSSNFVSSDPIDYRIIGGKAANKDDFPFAVSIQSGGRHICGGCLIDKEWVLSAANCFNGPAGSFEAVVGASKLDSKEAIRISVASVVIPEDYNPDCLANNVALAKLSQPVNESKFVEDIELENRPIGEHEECTAVGWGLTKYPSSNKSNELHFIKTKTISMDECQKQLQDFTTLSSWDMCTFTKDGQGFCEGDIGSPLVIKEKKRFKVIGVINWGVPCGNGFPDVSTRTSHYYDWMKNIMYPR